jgi:methylenetetrahydrofolate dehydrogenase (NADP+)/methenyltetrahydrofolate cyclohydrolase
MATQIIDGNAIAENVKNRVREKINSLGILPHLVAVQVGESPASRIYINNQRKICEEVGIKYTLRELNENISEEELIGVVEGLNADSSVNGVILQLPLPKHINPKNVQMHISPEKDVEGVHPVNLGRLVHGTYKVAPCTALAVMEILNFIGVEIKGKEAVVVGHSEIVGKPIALLLLSSLLESATVTVCHIATRDLAFHTRRAEILIVAVGKAGLIKGDMVKEGAIVIDVGINRIPVVDANGQPVIDEKTGKPKMRTVGDVAFDEVVDKVAYITPVPGGVGAVTTVMLVRNMVELMTK